MNCLIAAASNPGALFSDLLYNNGSSTAKDIVDAVQYLFITDAFGGISLSEGLLMVAGTALLIPAVFLIWRKAKQFINRA